MSFLNPFRSTPAKAAGPNAAAPDASKSKQAGAGTPLELISYNTDTGKFTLGQDALKVLRSVKGPVGVVAVSGRARQGKSFILNQLLGQSTGFVVAPTHRPCTKGLWMWSSPIERRNADGSKYHLVLLDTEGIDAYDQTGQYSTQIFSLAVLLSSLFVYNQMGGIDEAALDRLSLVTEMTKHVRVRAGSAAGEGEAELREFNPAFLWLLRDFYLDLQEDGHKLTPREYLEVVLRPLKGSGSSVEAKNKIRESIKNLFPNRDCFALVRPMSDESQLTKLDTIAPEKLRPQFVEDMKRLTRLIFMRAQPKRLGSQIISGAMLAALTEAYVDAINHGAVPTIATAWQGVAEAECRRAADSAEGAYHAAFDKAVATDESSMMAEHKRCLAIAHEIFVQGSIGDESIRKANEKRFVDRIESQFQQFRQQRLVSSESECRKLISEVTTRLTQLASKESTSLGQLQQELVRWEQRYRSAPGTDGPAKWQLHSDFLQQTYAGIVSGVVQRQEQATKAERLAAAERQRTHESRLQQEHARAAKLEEQLSAVKQELSTEQNSRQQAATKISALEEKLHALSLSNDKRLSDLQSRHSSEIQQLKSQIQAAENRGSESAASASQRCRDLQAQLTKAQQEIARLQKDAESTSTQHVSKDTELRRKSEALEGFRADLAAMQERLEVVNADVKEQTRARQSAEAQVKNLQTQLSSRPNNVTQASGPEDMEEDGYGTPDEDRNANLSPATMTINDIKNWMTENGHENVVWDLTTLRAKKPRYVEEMNKVLGRA